MKTRVYVSFTAKKWKLPFLASSLVSFILILVAFVRSNPVKRVDQSLNDYRVASEQNNEGNGQFYLQTQLIQSPTRSPLLSAPKLAYLISGTKGDSQRMKRVLQAIYHPNNQYILHLDLEASPKERIGLARYVKLEPIFVEFGNVDVIRKANLVTYRGPTMTACTLHAAAILLKKGCDWDWFINLSASDYPLITQDDLLYVFTYLPRNLNFLEHTSKLGWKESQRVKPIIIDPGFYMSKKSDIIWASQKRAVPNAFKLFLGSAWVVLTRSFVEYCVWGWDNLPRTILMYYANVVSSPEGYFHTVICNTKEFRNTTVNHDLHHIVWDTPPKQHPLSLHLEHFNEMRDSGAPFARKFERDDPVLDKIDTQLLMRPFDHFTPGGWCIGNTENNTYPCSRRGDLNVIEPGPGAKRFQKLLMKLLTPEGYLANQCI
ncbi:hypothetical protein KP509_06G031900 [Ceratopteris richardii]|uniref:Uncharacterized protein n=1 Tax=Ceratopteris richardii TaxID=49495 RepID=A0A8T2UMH6_CERRI|nr:hypothetical protein KP509_06G031900 [Ceratopteris richardii]